ncbi:NPCBM/NEW2 domain-containing protein [Botrimarina sp.]|uniref:NPCBM/NEW2 domain-containing protein n=1 Tax=Botrimarina sp. TaxID=2795802 RepID=UPI0032EAF07F
MRRSLISRLPTIVAALTAACWGCAAFSAEGPRVTVETIDQQHVGELVALGERHVQLRGDTHISTPAESVLRIEFQNPKGPNGAARGSLTLVDGAVFAYERYEIDGEQLRLTGPGDSYEAVVRLGAIAAWRLDEAVSASDSESTADTIWVRSRRSPTPKAVDGVILELSADVVRFALDAEAADQAIDVPWERVAGLRFYRPADRAEPQPGYWIDTAGGSHIAAAQIECDRLDELRWESDGSHGAAAIDSVVSLDASAGRVAPVSQLGLLDQQHNPYFPGQPDPFRGDAFRLNAAIDGGPLHLNFPDPRLPGAWPGVRVVRPYRSGVAVQSGTTLRFALPDGAQRLKGYVGLDPAAYRAGDAQVTVGADDRELVAARVRGVTRPIEINEPLNGARQLTLRVGYGENLDTGDRVHFADLRVIR